MRMWPSLHRIANRRNLSTSLEGRTNFTEYLSDTLRHSAMNTKIGMRKSTACFGWTGFRASVRSSVAVAIICRESREFGARIPNAGMITSDRLAAWDSTSVLDVAKRTLLFAEHRTQEVLLDLPHRQFVFAIPRAIRLFFRHDRRLLSEVSRMTIASAISRCRKSCTDLCEEPDFSSFSDVPLPKACCWHGYY
jgi:hypothetical protein